MLLMITSQNRARERGYLCLLVPPLLKKWTCRHRGGQARLKGLQDTAQEKLGQAQDGWAETPPGPSSASRLGGSWALGPRNAFCQIADAGFRARIFSKVEHFRWSTRLERLKALKSKTNICWYQRLEIESRISASKLRVETAAM